METTTDKTGVGSIWNKNSWHWEERNYSDQAKKYLEANLPILTVDSDNPPCIVRLYEVKSINGNASITIRKQKQIFLYEYTIEMYFDSKHKTDEETKCMGTIKIHEFNQDDDDIDITVTCEKPTEFVA